MSRKEDILQATFELAAEHGLRAVSLSMIADRLGIKKPSLYNHFSSKDEIIAAMYEHIRARSAQVAPRADMRFDGTLEQILTESIEGYLRFISDGDMISLFKVLYSERSTTPAAAQIILAEQERMIAAVRGLFYGLTVHGRMKNEDVDTAAYVYAMTVHAMVDAHMDAVTAGRASVGEMTADMKAAIHWFCERMKTDEG